jgi:hypothetical protein
MTAKKSQTKQEVDHRDCDGQAVDTPLPGDDVHSDVWEAMAAEYEGDPEEVDGHADDEDKAGDDNE